MFGHIVSLTFNGKTKFQTKIGAMITVICFIIIGGYGAGGLAKVAASEIISISTQEVNQ